MGGSALALVILLEAVSVARNRLEGTFGPRLRLRATSASLEKAGRICEGQLGQALAIEFHAGFSKTTHEAAVGQTVLPGRRIDSHDPEASEVSLSEFSTAV